MTTNLYGNSKIQLLFWSVEDEIPLKSNEQSARQPSTFGIEKTISTNLLEYIFDLRVKIILKSQLPS